ncbi:MAG: ComF family protein [Chloroflexi bacterium]|nr:ComF family protein [Chloroflexota bacterium]
MGVLPQVAKLGETALDLLFPKWCVGCGRRGDFICLRCQPLLTRIEPPLCPRCGCPQPSGVICPTCVGRGGAIDGIRSPFRFDGVIRQAVHQLKYRNIRALAVPLARFLSDYLMANPMPADMLIPVPLHGKRLRERGYNQSALLARELGKLVGLPVLDNCLKRERAASPQARTATVAERRQNVEGAFACRGQGMRDKAVLLVDDVATSGATLDACAIALKAMGAGSVWGLVLAREI